MRLSLVFTISNILFVQKDFSVLRSVELWRFDIENERPCIVNMEPEHDRHPTLPPVGLRLLPQVVDQLASEHPERIFASYAASQDLADGFIDVSMRCLSHAVNEMAWWIDCSLGQSCAFDTLCYIGISDIRYTIVFLATIKCGWKVMLPTPVEARPSTE